ncbi:MAG: glutamine amidotransferase [Dehalococcoidia bacterium]|nr:glutamine amidotransferase [Dehalococcoidia bacterium]
MRLTLAHLYADLMNVYADRGNIICLRQRCAWRGVDLAVRSFEIGDDLPDDGLDLVFMGGGQDGEQRLLTEDLRTRKGPVLREAADAGLPILAVCGAYQLFGHSYQPASGDVLPGLGILDTRTVHPGPGEPRCIGNVVVSLASPLSVMREGARGPGPEAQQREALSTLVGFENHGGRTFLGPTARPLGHVLAGSGNNAHDGTEGAVSNNVFGTYLHGSLLPKNPHFADHLLGLALARRYGVEISGKALTPLDDRAERQAHLAVRERWAPPTRWGRWQRQAQDYSEAWTRFWRGA